MKVSFFVNIVKTAAVVFGYGTIVSRASLKHRGLPKSKVIPVIVYDALYRGFGLPVAVSVDLPGFPSIRRTLGAYRTQGLPSGLTVPESYQLSGVVVPVADNDISILTISENDSTGRNLLYNTDTLLPETLTSFFAPDQRRLEGMLEGHDKVVYYKPHPGYSSPTQDTSVPISYIAVVVHGALDINPSGHLATHMLDNTLDFHFVLDDVTQGNSKHFLYPKARSGDQFTQDNVKFLMDYFSSKGIEIEKMVVN